MKDVLKVLLVVVLLLFVMTIPSQACTLGGAFASFQAAYAAPAACGATVVQQQAVLATPLVGYNAFAVSTPLVGFNTFGFNAVGYNSGFFGGRFAAFRGIGFRGHGFRAANFRRGFGRRR